MSKMVICVTEEGYFDLAISMPGKIEVSRTEETCKQVTFLRFGYFPSHFLTYLHSLVVLSDDWFLANSNALKCASDVD
jgi:hypothetical protein